MKYFHKSEFAVVSVITKNVCFTPAVLGVITENLCFTPLLPVL